MSLRGRIVLGIACALALTAVLGCTPQLQVSPATLSDAQVGSPYAATITVSQAETPVFSALVGKGALPAGLHLALDKEPVADGRTYTIQISGTPTVPGTFTFTIDVECLGRAGGGQTASLGYTLVVH
jgi:predicted RNA-binding protein with TRAM domain